MYPAADKDSSVCNVGISYFVLRCGCWQGGIDGESQLRRGRSSDLKVYIKIGMSLHLKIHPTHHINLISPKSTNMQFATTTLLTLATASPVPHATTTDSENIAITDFYIRKVTGGPVAVSFNLSGTNATDLLCSSSDPGFPSM